MPIVELLKRQSFDAETIAVIAAAFDDACRELGLSDRRDPITETLAVKIIEVAQTGEREPGAISQRAIASLGAMEAPPEMP
jgi:hypothetical protein